MTGGAQIAALSRQVSCSIQKELSPFTEMATLKSSRDRDRPFGDVVGF